MKIIFVSDAIYPYHKGGKEKRIFELSTRLVQAGHEVHIFTMHWWKGDIVKKENGVTLHGVCPFKPIYTKGRRSISQAVYFAFKIFWPLLKEKFDILEADNIPHFPVYTCKIICLLKGKKLFLTWHEVWGKKYWQEYLGKKGYLAYLIEKYSTKLPNYFLAVSEFTKRRLIDFFHVPEQKIKVIENGIQVRNIENKLEKKYDVIFAGRLLEHKKVDVFIKSIAEARKKMPEIKAVIIGQGPEKNNLIKLATQLNVGKNIIFHDFLSEEEFIKTLSESKIFLSCSIREGFGIAVLEALANGLPIIVIQHPENAAIDLVNKDNGFITGLFPLEIAEKIFEILSHETLYEKMQTAAFNSAKKYNWENNIKKLISFYQNVRINK